MRTLLAVRAGTAARVDDAACILRGRGGATAAWVDDAPLVGPEAGPPVPEAGEGEEGQSEGQDGETAAKSRHGKLLSREEAAPAGMAGGRTSLRE